MPYLAMLPVIVMKSEVSVPLQSHPEIWVVMQEKQAKERWGKEEAYQAYRRSTSLLLPIPKCVNIRHNSRFDHQCHCHCH